MTSDKLKSLRHTAEHVLMQAMGPATDQGFYFDFDTTDDLKISDRYFI